MLLSARSASNLGLGRENLYQNNFFKRRGLHFALSTENESPRGNVLPRGPNYWWGGRPQSTQLEVNRTFIGRERGFFECFGQRGVRVNRAGDVFDARVKFHRQYCLGDHV